MFTPHPSAALEYWFFKVNSGPIALIVDWIERRHIKEHWLRVSLHSPHTREVIFEKLVAFMPRDNYLSTQKSVGHAGDVAWELDIDAGRAAGRDWIKPDIFPAGLLKMADMSLVSAPLVTFSGWIRHGSQQTALNNVPGLVSHYWGRQLAPEWWWVAAHQFDQEGIAVECTVLRSSLWGTSIQLPLAYLYLRQGDKREFFVAPFNLARVKGSYEEFQIEFQRTGGKNVILTGVGREYGDFGDGIVNTLVGDLEIRQGNRVIGRAHGTAGLEHRIEEV